MPRLRRLVEWAGASLRTGGIEHLDASDVVERLGRAAERLDHMVVLLPVQVVPRGRSMPSCVDVQVDAGMKRLICVVKGHDWMEVIVDFAEHRWVICARCLRPLP